MIIDESSIKLNLKLNKVLSVQVCDATAAKFLHQLLQQNLSSKKAKLFQKSVCISAICVSIYPSK
jgi:hypothetical protein